MKFINLTPHVIQVARPNVCIQPSGIIARVSVARQVVSKAEISKGLDIPIFAPSFGTVENLPEPQDDTYLIVSSLVRAALPQRLDLLSPGLLERDEHGVVTGCNGFDSNHELI